MFVNQYPSTAYCWSWVCWWFWLARKLQKKQKKTGKAVTAQSP